MKLDIHDNLNNMSIYFRDALGYNVKRVANKPPFIFYKPYFAEESIMFEVSSIEHMLVCLDFERHYRKSIADVKSGKYILPEFFHLCYDKKPEYPYHPFFLVSVYASGTQELFTTSGIREIYSVLKEGFSCEAYEDIIDYFLFCYDRQDERFVEISQETVDKIESYLKEHNLVIYDSI